MSIICPSCSASLNQITNTHVRSKHPEFKSVTEFKEFFKLDTLWSAELTKTFVSTMTGKERDPYTLTDKYYAGVIRATEKRTGEQHWNYGNNWTIEEKVRISKGVKSSAKFQKAIAKWEDKEYREYRLEILNTVAVPNGLQTRIKNGSITAFEDKSAWDQYRSLVNKFTQQSLRLYRTLIDPNNLLALEIYDLDHKFSKFEGFKKGIPPEIIGSLINLTPLDWIENRRKRTKCSITEEELLLNYSEFVAANEAAESLKTRKS